jgi:hypothetical protein
MSIGLHSSHASFETRPMGAPQDEEGWWMALKKVLILRSPRRGRLEGRNSAIQP